MTEPVDLSIPDALLRTDARPTTRRRGHTDRLDLLTHATAFALAGEMLTLRDGIAGQLLAIGLAAIGAVIARPMVKSAPTELLRKIGSRSGGWIVGGLAGGLFAGAAIDEAQGEGYRRLVAVAAFAAAAVAVVLARKIELSPAEGYVTATAGAALEIRDLDFAYGTHQVLFGVSLTVAQGEIAALLGTNGAGKSTILRAVAGLDPPVAGSIHLFGEDATYNEAEDVLGMGVALLAGGRMTFPSLTVEENLRVGAFTLKGDTGIDDVYLRFPPLAARKQQRAGTLSGGEQQMLALGRVLLTKPRLLLIDELTLGLAPKVVEDLIGIVREVNAQGTTVLLVEQSVNLALALAAHSFFLERGEVRFDGPTADLLLRDDLLRPVFLTEAGA